jgi:hypothetical protein
MVHFQNSLFEGVLIFASIAALVQKFAVNYNIKYCWLDAPTYQVLLVAYFELDLNDGFFLCNGVNELWAIDFSERFVIQHKG